MVPSSRQPTAPSESSELKVPLADATTFLNAQVSDGQALIASLRLVDQANDPEEKLTELRHKVSRWRDMNRSWLDGRLGGPAAKEYRDASAHYYGTGVRLPISKRVAYLCREVGGEINKLDSIRERLKLWIVRTSHGDNEPRSTPVASNTVFVVHGSDESKAALVARQIDNNTDFRAIILHEQVNGGRTLIEKLLKHAEEAAYAVVLLTADDEGGKKGAKRRPRARQNVVLEMGLFFGLLGRERVCVLREPDVEKPSDIEGIVYVKFDHDGAWKTKLLNEIKAGGISD